MATIITNDDYATPQGGGSLCAVKTVKIQLTAAELVLDATFNIGKAPQGWKYHQLSMRRENLDELDTGIALRFHLGTAADEAYYYFSASPVSATCPAAGGNGSLKEFPDEDMILKINTAPTTAADGTLIVTVFGYD